VINFVLGAINTTIGRQAGQHKGVGFPGGCAALMAKKYPAVARIVFGKIGLLVAFSGCGEQRSHVARHAGRAE
jgi:hypothetical protein